MHFFEEIFEQHVPVVFFRIVKSLTEEFGFQSCFYSFFHRRNEAIRNSSQDRYQRHLHQEKISKSKFNRMLEQRKALPSFTGVFTLKYEGFY